MSDAWKAALKKPIKKVSMDTGDKVDEEGNSIEEPSARRKRKAETAVTKPSTSIRKLSYGELFDLLKLSVGQHAKRFKHDMAAPFPIVSSSSGVPFAQGGRVRGAVPSPPAPYDVNEVVNRPANGLFFNLLTMFII